MLLQVFVLGAESGLTLLCQIGVKLHFIADCLMVDIWLIVNELMLWVEILYDIPLGELPVKISVELVKGAL